MNPSDNRGATASDGVVAPKWVRVIDLMSLPSRYDVRIRGRRITILTLPSHGCSTSASYRAIDSVCYHMGGPLGSEGKLVKAGGRDCIKCPWHGHLVDLASGEGLYDGERGLQSKGITQRVHDIEARDDGGIWVRLRTGTDATSVVRSDEYAFRPKHDGIRTDYYQLPELDW
jgi:nitrite reductase/ring-hydroxylating ferredoxin subunit